MSPTTFEVEAVVRMWPLFVGAITLIVWLVRVEAKVERLDEKIKLNEKMDAIIKLLNERNN